MRCGSALSVWLDPNTRGFSGNYAGDHLVGALAIGAISEAALGEFGLSERSLLFLKTGFCGGFTTFSTFSLETIELMEQGRAWMTALYAIVSVALCMAGVLMGKLAVRALKAAV